MIQAAAQTDHTYERRAKMAQQRIKTVKMVDIERQSEESENARQGTRRPALESNQGEGLHPGPSSDAKNFDHRTRHKKTG